MKTLEQIRLAIKTKLHEYDLKVDDDDAFLDLPKRMGYRIGAFVLEDDLKDVSGILDYEKKLIMYHPNDPMPRKRFTIAHELGHLVLHGKPNEGQLYDYRSPPEGRQKPVKEIEADNFAAEILMPIKKFKEYWKKTHDVSLQAQVFGVSLAACAIRLERLGLS